MSRTASRLRLKRVAASGAFASLAAPLVVRAASFDQVFSNLPKTNSTDTQSAITNLFNNRVYLWGLYAVSVAAIFSIFYGGYLYITAQGSADQAGKARNAIIYAIIGLVVLGLMAAIMSASRNIGTGVANNSVRGTL